MRNGGDAATPKRPQAKTVKRAAKKAYALIARNLDAASVDEVLKPGTFKDSVGPVIELETDLHDHGASR